MKRKYINLFLLTLLILSGQMVKAQRLIEIPGIYVDEKGNYDYNEYEKAKDVIFTTIRDDAGRTDNTIYVLKRNHVYIAISTVESQRPLYIKGEAGSGRMPLVLHSPNASGTSSLFIKAQNNVTIEDFEFDGSHADGTFGVRLVDFRGNNSRAIVKGCRLINDRGGAITIETSGQNIKLYVSDCIIGNQGHKISIGGNGRAVDVRLNNASGIGDSIVFKNNTIYNLTDRVIRSMGALLKYVEFDHNTIINCEGYNGCVQLGNTVEAVITNNIFANAMTLGNRLDAAWRTEQTQTDKDFAIVTHNGLTTANPNPKVTMRNNNIFFRQEFLDFFSAHSDMFGPNVRATSDAIRANLVGDPGKISFTEVLDYNYNDREADNLGSVSSYKDLLDFTKMFQSNPKATVFPENFSQIYPYEWNAVYPTSSVSYTAADGGYPLGDLNWFPNDKAKWQTGVSKSAANSSKSADIEIIQTYPNPFIDETATDYSLSADQNIEISIYNLNGQKVKSIKSEYMKKGTYTVTWDGKNNNGNMQPDGIYYFVIIGSSGHSSSKVVKK
jgi:hypothetical protein